MDDPTSNNNAAPNQAQNPDPAPPPAPAPANPPAPQATSTAPAPGRGRRWRRAATAFWMTKRHKGGAVATTSTATAPPAKTQESPEALVARVEQFALASGTPLEVIVAMLSSQSAEVNQVIASFDEDKEHIIGKGVGHVVTVLCYILPWIIGFYAGYALGYTYSGSRAFDPRQIQYAYYYAISWGYEFTLCALMVGIVRQFKRIRSAGLRSATPLLIGLIAFFLILAITSACAQWILFESHINTHDSSQIIGAVFRTAGGPLIDAAGAVVLAVLFSISLDQQLNTMQKKNSARIALNQQNVKGQLETLEAAMQVKSTLQKEEDYQKKQDLANTLIGLFSEQAIESVKDQLQGRRTVNGSAYRRDGYR